MKPKQVFEPADEVTRLERLRDSVVVLKRIVAAAIADGAVAPSVVLDPSKVPCSEHPGLYQIAAWTAELFGGDVLVGDITDAIIQLTQHIDAPYELEEQRESAEENRSTGLRSQLAVEFMVDSDVVDKALVAIEALATGRLQELQSAPA